MTFYLAFRPQIVCRAESCRWGFLVWICLSCFTDSWTNSGAWVTFKSVTAWCLISKSRDNSPLFLVLKNSCSAFRLPFVLVAVKKTFDFLCYLLKSLLVVFPSGHDFLQLWEPVSATGPALFSTKPGLSVAMVSFSISVTNTCGGISCTCVILHGWWIGSKEWSVYLHSFVKNISSSGYQIMADLSDSASFVRFTGSGKRLEKATDQ